MLGRENLLGETIAWAALCISGGGRRIPANLFGALVATNEEPEKLVFVSRKFARRVDLEGAAISHEPRFLSENLVISPARGKGPNYSFIFARSDAALVEQIVRELRERGREAALHEEVTAESANPIG
jgi:hypothetical protein